MTTDANKKQFQERPIELVLHNIHDHGVEICDLWAEEVEQRTNNRVHFTKYIGKDAPLKGPADVVRDVPAEGNRYHLLDLIQTPLIIPNSIVGSKVIAQLYAEFAELRHELNDVKVVGLGTGAHMAIFSRKDWGPIRTLEDFKGATIRSLKPIDKAIEALGGKPVHVGYLEISHLLETGELDATVLGILPARVFRLAEHGTPYCTIMGGLSITMHPIRVSMRWDTYKKLPPDIQEIMEEIGPSGGDCWYAIQNGFDCDNHLTQALEYIKQNGEIITLTKEEQDRWRNIIKQVQDSSIGVVEAKGLPGRSFFNRMIELAEAYSPQQTSPYGSNGSPIWRSG